MGIMHARLSTVCNYEITPDPLYASIIIAFYASARETTANFSMPRARTRKVVLHFPSGCSLSSQLTIKQGKRASIFIVVKPTSSFMLFLTRHHFLHVTQKFSRELCSIFFVVLRISGVCN